LSTKEAEAAKAAQLARYNALKEKKHLLEEQLKRKLEELYSTCAQEAVRWFCIVIPIYIGFLFSPAYGLLYESQCSTVMSRGLRVYNSFIELYCGANRGL